MKHALITALVFLGLGLASAQAQVQWSTIQQAAKTDIGSRLYFVDFYTDWCGYCKKMDRDTFNNSLVSQILNRYYHPVKFNAETTETVAWAGRTYAPAPRNSKGRTHELARGLRGYPSFVIYQPDGTPLYIISGYKSADELIVILWYFASGDYRKQPFDKYRRNFKHDTYPSMIKQLKSK